MRFGLVATFVLVFTLSEAQETKSLQAQWLALESELDSFSIFLALDSALNFGQGLSSDFNIHLTYNSNISSTGRNFGLDQQGFSPGISYYHKSGFWGDLSGYWNSATDPNYNLTILSAGYLHYFDKKWSAGISYERWFSQGGSDLLENNLGLNTNYNFGPISANIDYSFLFGEDTANRFIGSLSGNIAGKWWFFDRVSINPFASIIVGNDNVSLFSLSTNERLNNLYLLTTLEEEEINLYFRAAVASGRLTTEQALRLRRALLTLTDDQLEELIDAVFIEENESVFDILNYSFGLPISFSMDRLLILLAYTYSIPVRLPGEEFTIDPIGYFSISLNYRLPTK